jgi:hypothetical protein
MTPAPAPGQRNGPRPPPGRWPGSPAWPRQPGLAPARQPGPPMNGFGCRPDRAGVPGDNAGIGGLPGPVRSPGACRV